MPILSINNPNPQAITIGSQHLQKVMLGEKIVWQKGHWQRTFQNLFLETIDHKGIKLVASNQNGDLRLPMFFFNDDYPPKNFDFYHKLTFISPFRMEDVIVDLEFDTNFQDFELEAVAVDYIQDFELDTCNTKFVQDFEFDTCNTEFVQDFEFGTKLPPFETIAHSLELHTVRWVHIVFIYLTDSAFKLSLPSPELNIRLPVNMMPFVSFSEQTNGQLTILPWPLGMPNNLPISSHYIFKKLYYDAIYYTLRRGDWFHSLRTVRVSFEVASPNVLHYRSFLPIRSFFSIDNSEDVYAENGIQIGLHNPSAAYNPTNIVIYIVPPDGRIIQDIPLAKEYSSKIDVTVNLQFRDEKNIIKGQATKTIPIFWDLNDDREL